jgi:hypothetical protein
VRSWTNRSEPFVRKSDTGCASLFQLLFLPSQRLLNEAKSDRVFFAIMRPDDNSHA